MDANVDFNHNNLKSDNMLVIDDGMDRGEDVGSCGCCVDIMVGSNKSSSNDCVTSASKSGPLADNADRMIAMNGLYLGYLL